MIRPYGSDVAVYLHVEPVDFRKQINGLAAIVQDELSLDPFGAAIYGFTNRRRNAVKLLVWERNGFVLWLKKLERHRFHWPRSTEPDALVELSMQQLHWLLDGVDLRFVRPHEALHYEYAA